MPSPPTQSAHDVRLLDGGRVLAVDDQPTNLDLVGEILENDGFTVDTALSGAAALAAVGRQPPDCIVLDVMMPEMDGLTVCRLLKADHRTRHIPVLMLTALSDVEDKLKSLRAGADDFLNKPVDRQEILARVRSLVRIKRLHDELNTAEAIMVAMMRALESKHPRSAGHADKVALGAVRLGAALDLPPADLHTLGQAAQLHDLGKLGVPEVLLTEESDHRGWGDEEERIFRKHAEMGEKILAPLAGFGQVRDLVRHHHERLDGTGYPDQLSGAAFTPQIEALALVNHFEDLASRSTREDACAELRLEAGAGRFRSHTVDAWLKLEAAGPTTGTWRAQLPTWQPTRSGTVLVADDDPANRELLAELLEQAGHTVLTAEHGAAVLRIVGEAKPDLLVTDIRMPYLNGFSICRALKADPDTEFMPIILVTASRGSDDRREGLIAGADDFLSVPVHKQELLARVNSLLRLHFYYRDLEEHQSVILSLAGALEAKDPYTAGHSDRVGRLAEELARHIGQPQEFCSLMKIAGLLHDIGKIGVPEKLLHKPGKLTDAEFRTIMTHPPAGEGICRPLRAVTSVLPFIKHHHERYDGNGYPDGLRGEQIPLGARVLAVADAYDALTSNRPYRKAMSSHAALEILVEETRGGKWEPRLVDALHAVVAQIAAQEAARERSRD
jgi:putative two-component system response regulator